jgi:hypothetical protein
MISTVRFHVTNTVAGFYRYAVEEDLLDHSPAAHVRRPRLDYESHATALDRNEVGALLVAAGLGAAAEHALISLLAINGLRISEALGADIDRLGIERGHRTLTVLRKGGKIVTIPLAPRTARAIDLAIGERLDGPTGRSSYAATGNAWIGIALDGSCTASRAARAWTSRSARTPCDTFSLLSYRVAVGGALRAGRGRPLPARNTVRQGPQRSPGSRAAAGRRVAIAQQPLTLEGGPARCAAPVQSRHEHNRRRRVRKEDTRSSPPPWTPASRCAMSRRRPRTPIPRTTMGYDRARVSLDRHATYVVAAYLAGAAR